MPQGRVANTVQSPQAAHKKEQWLTAGSTMGSNMSETSKPSGGVVPSTPPLHLLPSQPNLIPAPHEYFGLQ